MVINKMKLHNIILTGVIFMTGCDRVSLKVERNHNYNVAALPLIQEAIAREVPLFDGKWNAKIMAQVCQLANGELDGERFRDWFTERGVNVQQLAHSDIGFDFVAKADVTSAKTACAAWVISSQLSPLQAWGQEVDSKEKFNIKMSKLTPLVEQTINLLTRLADSTTQVDYSSEQEYQQKVVKMFIHSVPAFINSTLNREFKLNEYYRPGSKSSRYGYSLNDGNSEIDFNGVSWLGDGKLKGHFYSVRIKEALINS